ncbi:MAG: hypothetical protein R3F49_10380 [Planctomycetota bacterium]
MAHSDPMPLSSQGETGAPSPTFLGHATAAIGEVRRHLAAVIEALPGPIARASELQHLLGIDKALGWRVFNAVQCVDAFAAARYLPGSGGLRSFLRAARRKGAPEPLLSAVEEAARALDRIAREHAGDRKRFDMLLAAHSHEGRQAADLVHRRKAFEGNCYVWGASADVLLRSAFIAPSATPGFADMANLRGLVGLELLRPALRWPIAQTAPVQDDLRTPRSAVVESLYDIETPSSEEAAIFLSDPSLKIEARATPEGSRQYSLVLDDVGRVGAATCVTGDVVRCVGNLAPEDGSRLAGALVAVTCPARLLIFDLFLHRSLFSAANPEVVVRGELGLAQGPHEHSLPVTEQCERIGVATDVLAACEVPRYGAMRDFVFQRLGWDPAEFDVHRLRVEYPVLSSIVLMRFVLDRP